MTFHINTEYGMKNLLIHTKYNIDTECKIVHNFQVIHRYIIFFLKEDTKISIHTLVKLVEWIKYFFPENLHWILDPAKTQGHRRKRKLEYLQ